MQVDFNGLRLKLAGNYNDLLMNLKEYDIDFQDVKGDLNKMRGLIISLLCLYEDDNPDIRDLSDEVEILSPYEDIEDE